MKRIILLFTSLFFIISLSAQNFEGNWSGQLDMGLSKLPLVFNLKNNDGTYSATLDSPAQGTEGIAINTVNVIGDSISLKLDALSITYAGRLKNDTIQGVFKQGGYSLSLSLVRIGEKLSIVKKQNPQPPFPYISKDVTITHAKANITLAGTLTLPSAKGKFPAVILVSGSGPQNRDEEILGHKPFLVLADHLTRHGIAVLRYDDRGVGKSKGDFITGTSADFADDAYAVHQFLKNCPEIDATRVGVIGHSEGGLISFMLAARHADISFVVSLAGTALQGNVVMKQQRTAMYKAQKLDDAYISANEEMIDKMQKITEEYSFDYIQTNLHALSASLLPVEYVNNDDVIAEMGRNLLAQASPWMQYFLQYDPASDLSKITCPIFALNGDKDMQVMSDNNLVRIISQVRSNGNKSVKTKSYPKLNHLFQTCRTGSPSEYGLLKETLSEEVMSDISSWILQAKK